MYNTVERPNSSHNEWEINIYPGLDDLCSNETALLLSLEAATHLLRIAQEAVANARRHARDATFVQVRVTREDDSVRLVVTDDGRGSAGSGDGFGIVGMTERATLLGGHLEAGSLAPLVGWRVTATLPLEEAR